MKSLKYILCLSVLSAPFALHATQADANTAAMSTESAFIVADKDRSGSISPDELQQYIAATEPTAAPVSQDFAMMDLNKDNSLTMEELSVGEDIYPTVFR